MVSGWLKNNFFAVILGLGVVAYHWINHAQHFPLRPIHFYYDTVSFRGESGKGLSIPMFRMTLGGREVFIVEDHGQVRFRPQDYSSGQIARVGHIGRFLAGQEPHGIVFGKVQPLQTFFYRDDVDVQFPRSEKELQEGFREQFNAVTSYFRENGISLVIAPIPTHLSMQRELHSRPLRRALFEPLPARTENPYAAYRQIVDLAPKESVDLFRAFEEYRAQHPQALLFGNVESHWTSEGIAVAANAVAGHLRDRGWKVPPTSLAAVGSAVPQENYDFIKRLFLPAYFTRRMASLDWHEELFQVVPKATGPRTQRLILAGTSCGERWKGTPYGFGEILAEVLQRDLVNLSTAGLGPHSISNIEYHQMAVRPGDLVIWELSVKIPFPKGERPFLPKLQEPHLG